jgi:hypothetical protein
MALSTLGLDKLLGDLRIRLNEITEEELKNEELVRWLNLGCFDTALQLIGISGHWFLSKADLAKPSAAGIVSLIEDYNGDATNIVRLDRVYYDGGTPATRQLIPIVNVEELEGHYDNAIIGGGSGVGCVCAHWGENLYFSDPTWANGKDAQDFKIVYIKRPTKMDASAADYSAEYMDVPVEFQDLVVSFAQVRAMQKKGIVAGRKQLQQDIFNRIGQIREGYWEQLDYKEQLQSLWAGAPLRQPASR